MLQKRTGIQIYVNNYSTEYKKFFFRKNNLSTAIGNFIMENTSNFYEENLYFINVFMIHFAE